MRNNITAYKHPTIQRAIRRALWLAKLAAHANAKGLISSHDAPRLSKQYVQNRHGRNIMRIDYSAKHGVTVWGDQSRNITNIVLQALA